MAQQKVIRGIGNGLMDDERLNVLCDELRSLVRQEIQGSVDSKGTDVREDASNVVDGFQFWFSPRRWNQSGDEGRHVKLDILASILKLEGAVRQIHSSRVKPTRSRHR